MKLYYILKNFCVFLIVFFLFSFFQPPIIHAFAEENTVENPPILDEAIDDVLERLDVEKLEEYVRSLSGENNGVKDRILSYIKGDSIDYGNFFIQLSEVFFKEIQDLIPAFSCVIAIALLCGILSSLQIGNSSLSVTKTVYLIAFIVALLPILNIITECYTKAKESVTSMTTQMQLIFPILLTLLSASGGVTSVAICKPSVAFLSTAMVQIISEIVFPVAVVLISFSIAGKISNDFKFNKFVALFKSINKWLIGIGLSVFALFFTVQGITSATYDGIAKRAVKYAIGNGIPIVGGFLSGGFDLAIAGSVLIKNSLGYLGIVLMISTIFQPLLLILSTNLLLRFSSALTSPFGDSAISDFLNEVADSLNYLAAGILFTAFLYFLSIIIIITASGVFF